MDKNGSHVTPPRRSTGSIEADKKLAAADENATYWVEGGRKSPDRNEAVICIEQGVNAWKNCAWALAENVAQLEAALAGTRERVDELCARSESERSVTLTQHVAEHLYGTSIEAGGSCHVCQEFRAAVDAVWPQPKLPDAPK